MAGLGGGHVHIECAVVLERKARQLEVVGGEQREGAVLVVQVRGDGAGEREAVEGRGAASDLVHQHQRVLGRTVQDCRGLGHLEHEGRLGVGEIVGRADAGMDRVDRPEPAGLGRDERAHRREQRDQRDLAHEGALAAHVRAGDDEHLAVGVEPAVVGHEIAATGFGEARFDDRMAAGFDRDARLANELRAAPAQRQRAFGQRRQRVEARERARQIRQFVEVRLQLVDQLFVEQLLARERPLLRRQRLVLEGLQLGRDEALGILQCLAALVVERHLVDLALRDLDVEAMHLVVLDAQVGDAGARAFARLEVQQEAVAVVRDAAQLVELGVETARDDAAVAQQHRRLFGNRGAEQGLDVVRRGERFGQHVEQHRGAHRHE